MKNLKKRRFGLSFAQQVLLVGNALVLLFIAYLFVTESQAWARLASDQTVQTQPAETPEVETEQSSREPVDPKQLMPHKNHNYEAAAYAYDIKTIRQYIRGELPYEGENLVFLTIDDGPSPGVTDAVLDVLKEYGVHASFFPIGSKVTPETEDLMRRELHEGHAIGIHSFTHNMDLLYPGRVPDDDRIIFEAQEAYKSLRRTFGMAFETHNWRYPGGAMSWSGLETSEARLADEVGLEWLDWNAYLGDAEPDSRRPGDLDTMLAFHTMTAETSPINVKVVLMHDAEGKQLTIEALPYIIQYYKERGYTFGVLE